MVDVAIYPLAFQVDLPVDMVQIKGSFAVNDIRLSLYAENDHSEGDDRIERWQAYVEAERLDNDEFYPTKSMFKELDSAVKTLVFSPDRKGWCRFGIMA
ncbi:MAG: hypothetical protein V5789_00930 [Colwellia sp.]